MSQTKTKTKKPTANNEHAPKWEVRVKEEIADELNSVSRDYVALDYVGSGERRVAIIPHPSGINRWYNDSRNMKKINAFMRSTIREKR